MSVYRKLSEYVSLIENALPSFLPEETCLQGNVVRAMKYSLTSGGKRLRAALIMASAELFGIQPQNVVPFSVAIEMIHAYSLIHDDLPCMDDDYMRRGKPSCHAAFGEATALLAGDALLTLAFEVCTCDEVAERFGAKKTLKAVNALAKAAGWHGMIGGQVIDIESEGIRIPVETLQIMDEKKTGALIAVAVKIGCILGGADSISEDLLCDYALKVGLAFQIVDDILDQVGDEKLIGKPVGSDFEKEKSTYTSFYGVNGAKELAAELSRTAKDSLAKTGMDTSFFSDFADTMLDRKY